jgi:predicted DNA-binding transcriptional regulator YafY
MTDRLERLINLIIALRESPRPLTAADVRARVAGYGGGDGPRDDEAFRRMFERDKADLRALGVPVETTSVDPHRFFGDDRVAYRIDPERYDLPPVALDPAELSALAVAVQATGLTDEAGWSLRKLAVDVGQPEAARAADPGLGVDVDAPHRGVLLEAQLTRSLVRFRYRGPGRRPGDRTVEPHALVHRGGRWYLVGHDRDRDGRRAFRLDRIEGEVVAHGGPGAFDPPAADIGVADVVPPPAAGAPQTAQVRAAPEVAWLVARRARGGGTTGADGWTSYEVAVGDVDAFTSWLLELGPDVEVTGPAQVRAHVAEVLDVILAAHQGVAPGEQR